jgi:hypothetical protein
MAPEFSDDKPRPDFERLSPTTDPAAICSIQRANSESRERSMPRHLLLAAALLAGTALGAEANTFRWANDGDVNSMDPYARNETFLLSFNANIYEPLVRRNRQLQVEPALAARWEQTSPTVWRFHLRRRREASATARRSRPTTSSSPTSARAARGRTSPPSSPR